MGLPPENGEAIMTTAEPARQLTPAAERVRLTRQRRRDGMRVIPFEVRDEEIEALVARGLLEPVARNDRSAIARRWAICLTLCLLNDGRCQQGDEHEFRDPPYFAADSIGMTSKGRAVSATWVLELIPARDGQE